MDIGDLESKKLSELRDIGRDMKIPGYTTMKKQDLVFRIMQADAESSGFHFRGGVLEVVDEVKDVEGMTLASTSYLSMCDVREQSFFAGREQSGRIDAKFARRAGLYGARYEHRPTPDGLIVVMRLIPDDGNNIPTLPQLGFWRCFCKATTVWCGSFRQSRRPGPTSNSPASGRKAD